MWGACRQLREDFYRAYLTRASSGDTDNTPIIEKTLALRQEKAKLLGYSNFAEVSMAKKVRGCVAPVGRLAARSVASCATHLLVQICQPVPI